MGLLERNASGTHPFNGTLETGIRALVVLEAFYPRRCDLLEMTWLDHLVVHTGDFDGQDVPESLHPDLPNRAGELLVRRQLVEKSLRLMQQVTTPRKPEAGAQLTDREREVLRLLAEGRSNKEIARSLVVSERTAKGHVSNILGKLGLQDRTQAALYAVRHGLAPEP